MSEIVVGSKFFRYDNKGNLNVVRVIGYKNLFTLTVKQLKKDGKNIPPSGIPGVLSVYNVSRELLEQEYTLLEPDGAMFFITAKLKVGEKREKEINDIIISLYKYDDIIRNNTTPAAVCRQNIRNLFFDTAKIYDQFEEVGMCMTPETTPPNIDYNIMTACDGVDKLIKIFTYCDDNLDDILGCIKGKYMREMNTVLAQLKEMALNASSLGSEDKLEAMNADIYHGYCKTVKTLLKHTEFMYDYERAFYITKFNNINMDFDKVAGSNEDDTFIVLSSVIDILEKAYNMEIYNPCFIKFDKDIDLSKIPRNKLLIKDFNDVVYICMYDTKESPEGALLTKLGNVFNNN